MAGFKVRCAAAYTTTHYFPIKNQKSKIKNPLTAEGLEPSTSRFVDRRSSR